MLEKLSHVQRFDLNLDALEEDKKRTPDDFLTMRRRQEELQAALNIQLQRHDELRREIDANELELKDLVARRKAAADSAIRASSGKEAAQYQNQELQFATRVEELETDTLPMIEQLEEQATEIASLQQQLAELKPQLEALVKTEQARVAQIDQEIAAIAGERAVVAREINPELLKQYEQVRRSKRGLGLAAVRQQRCAGCNMRLPIHVVQKVHKAQEVTRCPSCGRILWLEVEL